MKKILITAAAIALLATTASAKSAGDSFYVKGSLGYGVGQKIKAKGSDGDKGTSKNGKGLLGNIGAGMSFANGFRSDAELYVDDGIGIKKGGVTLKYKTLGLFLNGYYDFKNSSPLTPYVMAGLGWANTKFSVDVGNTTTVENKKSKNTLAYQAGVGVSYAVSKTVALDVGYRYIDKRIKEKSMGSKFSLSGIHAGLVGVRFSF